jgi:hypothetical protein
MLTTQHCGAPRDARQQALAAAGCRRFASRGLVSVARGPGTSRHPRRGRLVMAALLFARLADGKHILAVLVGHCPQSLEQPADLLWGFRRSALRRTINQQIASRTGASALVCGWRRAAVAVNPLARISRGLRLSRCFGFRSRLYILGLTAPSRKWRPRLGESGSWKNNA